MNSSRLMSLHALLAGAAAIALVSGCGGSAKKTTGKPKTKIANKKSTKGKTEADYVKERMKAIHAIVPEGSTCLPEEKLTYQLTLAGEEIILCGNDADRERALGQIACWSVDKASHALTYKGETALPGRSTLVKTEAGCARGYCPPTKLPAGPAHIAWSSDSSKVAVVVGTTASLFEADSKKHLSDINLADEAQAEKAVKGNITDFAFVGDTLFVVGAESAAVANVWMFKADGTAQGTVGSPNPKEKAPISVHAGSLVVLDSDHVGLSEAGLSALYSVEVSTGKRSKIVRKLPKFACSSKELAAYWSMDGSAVPDKCKTSLDAAVGGFIGSDLIAGKKAMLGTLQGKPELVVLDLKNLAEKTTIKLAVCGAEGADAGGAATE